MIKDILVHLKGDNEDETRLAHARLVARGHGAFITGIFTNIIPENRYIAGDGSMLAAQAAARLKAEAIEDAGKTEELLAKRLKELGKNTELKRVDVTMAGAGMALTRKARVADLMVATRPYNHFTATPEMLETVLFNSGRAILFAPPSIKPAAEIEHVVVAWSDTRESARAVSEALPIMLDAKKVTVAMVTEDKKAEGARNPGTAIAGNLSRHGIDAKVSLISGWANPADALLNEVEKSDAQLLVMGGYGHSRFREWVLGGVTRDILRNAEIPVFMSH